MTQSKNKKVKSNFFILAFIFIVLKPSAFANNVESTGDVLLALIPTATYATTLYLNDEDGQTQFYKSFASNVGATYALKYAVDKERPNGKERSFPSGHTSGAFQAASFIHLRYGFLYSIPAYIGATFVGYSRVDSKNHYTDDVVAGALIGSLSSFYFTTKYKQFEVKPLVFKSAYGLTLSYNW